MPTSEPHHGPHTPPHSIAIPPLPLFGPLSPPQSRVPMTPSMPGFTFHPFPQTPPLMPQFLSPGLGPFSPPLGGPSFSNRPYMNAAPGAPIHLPPGAMHTPNFNSFYSSSYFPSVPPHPLYEAPEPPDHHIPIPEDLDRIPSETSTPSKIATDSLNIPSLGNSVASAEINEIEETQGYFPPVSALLARRASTNSGAQLPNLPSDVQAGSPPVGTTLLPRDHRTASGTQVSPAVAAIISNTVSAPGSATQAPEDDKVLTDTMENLSLNQVTSLPRPKSAASVTSSDAIPSDVTRRPSIVGSDIETNRKVTDPVSEARRRFEGEITENRRASFETGDLNRARQLAFGQSIWTSEWGNRANKS